MTNQIVNPSFESSDLSAYGNGVGGAATMTRVQGPDAPDGLFVLQQQYLTTSNLLLTQVVPANPGEVWSAGCTMRRLSGTARACRVDLLFLDNTATVIQTSLGTAVTVTNTYARYKIEGVTAPALTVSVRLRITYVSPVVGDGYEIDAVQAEVASTLPPYNPGTIIAAVLAEDGTAVLLEDGTPVLMG